MPDLGPGGDHKIPQAPVLEPIEEIGKSKLTDDEGTDIYLNNPLFGNTVDQESVRIVNKTVQGYNRLYNREHDFGLRIHKFISPNNIKATTDAFEVFAEYYQGKRIRYVTHTGQSIRGFLGTDYKLTEKPLVWCSVEELYKVFYDLEFTIIECL